LSVVHPLLGHIHRLHPRVVSFGCRFGRDLWPRLSFYGRALQLVEGWGQLLLKGRCVLIEVGLATVGIVGDLLGPRMGRGVLLGEQTLSS